MILDGISRYGDNFDGIIVISELAMFYNTQFLSSWDIRRERDLGHAVFIKYHADLST